MIVHGRSRLFVTACGRSTIELELLNDSFTGDYEKITCDECLRAMQPQTLEQAMESFNEFLASYQPTTPIERRQPKMQITIDKNVPIPESKFGQGGFGRKPKYPFADMEVGDSFLVKCIRKQRGRVQTRLCNAASIYKRKHDRKTDFTTRASDDEGGIRVWRIV